MVDLNGFADAAKGLSRNPLGIIALFIVLIYAFAALTLGTSTLQPNERLPLVWFMVLFPMAVLVTFAWLVSKHHEKLYAPADYHSDEGFLVGVEVRRKYALELRAQQDELKKRLKEAVIASTTQSGSEKRDYTKLVERITEEVDRATTIKVDARDFLQNPNEVFTLPVAAYKTLGDLMDDLYFKINERVRPYEYGYTWILRNARTGELIKSAAMITQARPGIPVTDRRTLSEMGITPGTELTVEVPAGPVGG